MAYTVAIKRNSDGEVRISREIELSWEDHSDFWWTEGNMSCDCNRHLEFERAGGKEMQWDDGGQCGNERYTALYAELPDGKRIDLER